MEIPSLFCSEACEAIDVVTLAVFSESTFAKPEKQWRMIVSDLSGSEKALESLYSRYSDRWYPLLDYLQQVLIT